MVSAQLARPPERESAPFNRAAWRDLASLRLDELVAQGDNLRCALTRSPHDARLSAALLIVEDERMAIEGMLK